MKGYTFKDLAYEVLDRTRKPMSANQIWQKADELGLAERVGSKGKTPAKSINSQIYVDIRDAKEGTSSRFVQLSKHPVLFGLKDLVPCYGENEIADASNEVKTDVDKATPFGKGSSSPTWYECDLHPLLATYVHSDPHFRCYAKTIHQEKSSKRSKNADMWTHPDMIGVYYPFGDFEEETIQLQTTLCANPYRVFSFELKRSLSTDHLREYFFQAVSNSSWANEGYLVAPDISTDSDFFEDLQRLSGSFGIGVIRLDIEHSDQSEIILRAQTRDSLDWPMVDRLSNINPDFRDFVTDLNNSVKIRKATGRYDEILEEEFYGAYLRNRGMA